MRYLVVDNGLISNIIVCSSDTAAEFGAVPCYDGAVIGAPYDPPAPEPSPPTELQELGQQITDEQLERIAMGQEFTDLELAILQGGTSHV